MAGLIIILVVQFKLENQNHNPRAIKYWGMVFQGEMVSARDKIVCAFVSACHQMDGLINSFLWNNGVFYFFLITIKLVEKFRMSLRSQPPECSSRLEERASKVRRSLSLIAYGDGDADQGSAPAIDSPLQKPSVCPQKV